MYLASLYCTGQTAELPGAEAAISAHFTAPINRLVIETS